MASLGYSENEFFYSIDDTWGFDFDLRTEEDGEPGNRFSGFPGNQTAEMQFPNMSTSGSAYSVADGSAPHEQLDAEPETVIGSDGRRRRRRARSKKNPEDVESQRMTHIAVERNRRKQMSEYLSVIRSLMPESYSRRGDQSSIVGGAINYVKELEHQLQELELRPRREAGDCSSSTNPSYTAGSSAGPDELSADVEVSLVDGHANIRVRSEKRPRQLLELVKGLQSLGLSVLHLNLNTVDRVAQIFSISVKVEDGCKLTSGDEIATAVCHILGSI